MPTTSNNALAAQVFHQLQGMLEDPHRVHYGVYAIALASMIRLNGLHQTLDYLAHGINDDARKTAAVMLRNHLLAVIGGGDVATLSGSAYALTSRRALAAAQYFKRFAESVLHVERAQESQRP